MCHDVSLLETDGQSELLAGSGQIVHEVLKALFAVGCQGGVVCKQQITYQHLVLARSLATLKSLPSCLVRTYTPSSQSANAYWRSIKKKIPNRVGAKTQPCFTPLLTGKGSEVAPSKQTVLCMPWWKEVMTARSFGGQPIF